MKLKDKVCIVTGGNSGIGFGIAEQFAREGAKGAILGRNGSTLTDAQNKLGKNFFSIRGDITKPGTIENLFKSTLARYGKVDIVVACAGGPTGPGSLTNVIEIDEKVFDDMINLNLKSVFFTLKKSLPYLATNASIIIIGSLAAHKGYPGSSLYNASKAGILILGKTFAVELAELGIRVNIITPGVVESAIFSRAGIQKEMADQIKAQFVAQTPLKRIGTPREIGKAAVFLASADASFVTGAELFVDGGLSIQ